MATGTRWLARADDARSKVCQHPRRRSRWLIGRVASLGGATALVAVLAGCGTSFNELLFQSGAAVGRSALDQAITDLLNQLANPTEPTDGDGTGDTTGGDTTGGDTGGGDPTGGDPGALTGDAATGQAVYMANGCGGCHCDDAAGGCALSAPSIIAVEVPVLDDILRGGATHPVKPPVSDQDLADLTAWLATL